MVLWCRKSPSNRIDLWVQDIPREVSLRRLGSGLIRERVHADHSDKSVQGTPVSRRRNSASRTVVPAISVGLRACRRAIGRARQGSGRQLCLALGASLLAGIEQAFQPHLKRTNKSFRVDETYIKVKGQDKYLYRAVDSTGQTIDFLLTANRDTAAAQRFFEKVFSSSSNPIPRVIKVNKNPGLSGCYGKL